MRQAKGFTLIEVMVVVAIVAILSAIAVPGYNNYVMRSKISEAVANLSDMRVKMEQYFLDNRTYVGACAAGTVAPMPTGRYFTFACPTLTATTYTITATGIASEGMGGPPPFVYTIDQNNTRVTVSAPPGWSASLTCWTLRKDGSC
jgi:type IV pilus assembly protein PilE